MFKNIALAAAVLFVSFTSASAGDYFEKYNGHRNVMNKQIYSASGRPASFKNLFSEEVCKKLAKSSETKQMCGRGNSFKLVQGNTCTLYRGVGSDGNFIIARYKSFDPATGHIELCTY